jgi:mRNA interferase HigB
MRIYSRSTLRDFREKFPDSREQLLSWYEILSKNDFKNTNEIKEIFGSADFVKNGKIIFNISVIKYRLITKMNYTKQLFYVLFLGSHKEYDKIDIESIIKCLIKQYENRNYLK